MTGVRGFIATVALVVLAAGCTQTQYQAFDPKRDTASAIPLSRVVNYELGEAYFRTPPSCVLVLPLVDARDSEAALLIEESAARFLRERVMRVIGPHQRRADERRLAVQTSTDEGRQVYTANRNCDSYLRLQLQQVEAVYALFWSGRQIGLSASLMRSRDHTVMWRAAHTARRSDGGLPLSLLSLPLAAYESTRFHTDTDVVPSMVDDVVRRMFATLPPA